MRDTFAFFIKLPKVNNRPKGENSPNLVTLLLGTCVKLTHNSFV
jgi:hypothetical protein